MEKPRKRMAVGKAGTQHPLEPQEGDRDCGCLCAFPSGRCASPAWPGANRTEGAGVAAKAEHALGGSEGRVLAMEVP